MKDRPKLAAQILEFFKLRIVPAGECVRPPRSEDYITTLLVSEVGVGPGFISEEEVKYRFPIYRNLAAVRYRRNFIAVEAGRSSFSIPSDQPSGHRTCGSG